MKKLLFIILLPLSGCTLKPYICNGVGQVLKGDCRSLCSPYNDPCVMTMIWINQEIVYSSYSSAMDSIKIKKQKHIADSIYNKLKTLKLK